MTLNTVKYSINHSKIVFEKFDDEVVLINLDNGNYFSIRSMAVVVWNLIDAGCNVQEIVAVLAGAFETDKTELEADTQLYINELIAEDLIIVSNDAAEKSIEAAKIEPLVKTYSKPQLEVYSDMQDLILLDPIHEVDETGWPNAKQDSETSEK